MNYFRAEVMEMCHSAGLYQIDLLGGSKNRVSEREYWAAKKGQVRLDAENAALSDKGQPTRETKFETEKEKLRQTIRAVLAEAVSFEDFAQRLLQHGITVKESRGRLSYLTPDRSKPITTRKLGDNFDKAAVLSALENQRQSAERQTVQPMAPIPIADQPEDLDACVSAACAKLHDIMAALKPIESALREKKELQRYVLDYRKTRPVRDGLRKQTSSKARTAYQQKHESALLLAEAAARYFKEHGVTSLPSSKVLQVEIEQLTVEKNACYTEYRAQKQHIQKLYTIKSDIDQILRQTSRQEQILYPER